MKKLLLFFCLLITSNSYSADFTWYNIKDLKCTTSKMATISYTTGDQMFSTVWGLSQKKFYPDGVVFKPDLGVTQIGFTGHKPSAGPVLDIWESDYTIEIKGPLTEEAINKVQGTLYRSIAFMPRYIVSTINCSLIVGNSF